MPVTFYGSPAGQRSLLWPRRARPQAEGAMLNNRVGRALFASHEHCTVGLEEHLALTRDEGRGGGGGACALLPPDVPAAGRDSGTVRSAQRAGPIFPALQPNLPYIAQSCNGTWHGALDQHCECTCSCAVPGAWASTLQREPEQRTGAGAVCLATGTPTLHQSYFCQNSGCAMPRCGKTSGALLPE